MDELEERRLKLFKSHLTSIVWIGYTIAFVNIGSNFAVPLCKIEWLDNFLILIKTTNYMLFGLILFICIKYFIDKKKLSNNK